MLLIDSVRKALLHIKTRAEQLEIGMPAEDTYKGRSSHHTPGGAGYAIGGKAGWACWRRDCKVCEGVSDCIVPSRAAIHLSIAP